MLIIYYSVIDYLQFHLKVETVIKIRKAREKRLREKEFRKRK
jgi:hypothetical protein